jgi:hypothetical protein
MKYTTTILLLLLGALLVSACSNQAVYTGESFASDSPFRMRADGDVAIACESARRALLGQGYLIEAAGSETVKGRKAYNSQDTQNTFIEMNIVCLSDASGSTLYATGVLTTYALKKSTSSASVGLSALGSISLPIGQSADSLVKVSEATIDDKDFYKRFFSAVDIILGEMRASGNSAAPVAPEPGPAPASIATPATAPVPATVEPSPVQPAPTAVPAPAPAIVAPPTPVSAPTPASAPASVSAPTPVAAPTPVSAPEPVSTPTPAPASTTVAAPEPTAPAAEPAPAQVAPVALPQAAPAPTVTPEPAQPQQPAVTRATTPAHEAPKPAATQAPSTTVLEEFAAPRDTPY